MSQIYFIFEFYDQYKDQEQVSYIDIQGWFFKLKINVEEVEGVEKIIDKIIQLCILMMDDGNFVILKEYQKLLKNMCKNGFEEFFWVCEGNEDVGFYIWEENKKVINVLLIVYGQDNFILFSLEGLLKFSDFNDFYLDIEGMEYFENLLDKKEDILCV